MSCSGQRHTTNCGHRHPNTISDLHLGFPANPKTWTFPHSSAWIGGARSDLLFIIGPPLILFPLVLGLSSLWTTGTILAAISIAATGHHWPGMLRAYGERSFRRTYPGRLIAAPLLILMAFLIGTYFQFNFLKVLLVLWGHWHGMMQLYGFTRIYAVKSGVKQNSRLDWLMCFTWFAGGIMMSDLRVVELYQALYWCGVSTLPATILPTLRAVWMVAAICISSLFIFAALQTDWRKSLLKHMHMALSFSTWWSCMLVIKEPVIGLAIFEAFHDIQYIAFGWMFKKRSREGSASPVPLRSSFRFAWIPALTYFGLVALYGATPLLRNVTTFPVLDVIVVACLGSSTLIHFYFDGFIWKLKTPEVQARLGLPRSATKGLKSRFGGHLALWTSVWAIAAALAFSQSHTSPNAAAVGEKLATSLPELPMARAIFATSLADRALWPQAYVQLKKAQALDPSFTGVQLFLGETAMALGQYSLAKEHLAEALHRHPADRSAWSRLGVTQIMEKDLKAAAKTFDHILNKWPTDASAHYYLGRIAGFRGQHTVAIAQFEHSLALDSHFEEARINLEMAEQVLALQAPAATKGK